MGWMSLTKSIFRSTGGGSLLASTLAALVGETKRPEVASRRAKDHRARTKNLKLACTRLILMPDPALPVYGENSINSVTGKIVVRPWFDPGLISIKGSVVERGASR